MIRAAFVQPLEGCCNRAVHQGDSTVANNKNNDSRQTRRGVESTTMNIRKTLFLSAGVSAALFNLTVQAAETVTIATVNNGDMIRMQRLSKTFEQQHPDTKLNWVVLEENVLRQRLTTDIATQGGQFDVLTLGTYESP